MPHQNRVTPLGELVAHPPSGGLMGNRGQLHDAEKRIRRKRWTTQTWVTCTLTFNGRKREIMAPGCYTELFLDEATALAAGHRPCAECRRDRHRAFVHAWQLGTGGPIDGRLLAKDIDRVMHKERTTPVAKREPVETRHLPDGSMVTDESRIWLRWGEAFHEWSFEAYRSPIETPGDRMILVTPESTVRALRSGYSVEVHPTLSA